MSQNTFTQKKRVTSHLRNNHHLIVFFFLIAKNALNVAQNCNKKVIWLTQCEIYLSFHPISKLHNVGRTVVTFSRSAQVMTDPLLTNSTTMHSRLVCQDRHFYFGGTVYYSVQQIVIYAVNRKRNIFAEASLVHIGKGIVCELQTCKYFVLSLFTITSLSWLLYIFH